MKRIDEHALTNPIHRTLQRKDERELYGDNPLDYYALHYRRRISAVVDIIRKNHAENVLEIGCAQGNISLYTAESKYRSVAVDINLHHLTYSRMKREKGDISWVTASADALPFKTGGFDAVILGELLEHCAYPEAILQKAAAMLSPGGIIVITTPNNSLVNSTEPPFSSVAANRTAIETHQFGPDGDSHLFTFTPDELTRVINESGLSVMRKQFIGSHFLHLPKLYRLRKAVPLLFNTILENITPLLPGVNRLYCETLLYTVTAGGSS